jgi:hypothetical protein
MHAIALLISSLETFAPSTGLSCHAPPLRQQTNQKKQRQSGIKKSRKSRHQGDKALRRHANKKKKKQKPCFS